MKQLLLVIICSLVASAVSAQSLDYLTLRMTDGSVKSLPAEGLKITFGGGQLHAVATDFKADFELTAMSVMFFSAEATTVQHVESTTETVAIVNGRLVVNAPVGSVVKVYRMDGRQVDAHSQLHGAYVVKVNGRTHKLIAR